MLNGKRALVLALASFAAIACTKKDDASTTTTVDASKPSSVIGAINSKVASVGSGLEGVSAFSTVDDQCDEHATPKDGVSSMAKTHVQYPMKYFYCMIMKDTGSPDSVPGSYSLVKNISCALENSGQLVYDGASHSATITIDSTCFTANQISQMGGSMTVTITASHPASFNSNFDYGVIMDVPSFGTFKYATKQSGNTISFIATEDQTSHEANKTGAYGASYDSTTGVLSFEARHDRYACTTASSCKWSRHQRIQADLALDGSGNVTGVDDFAAVGAEIYDNGGGSYSGQATSMKGNLTDGLKARAWTISTSTEGDLDKGSAFTETTANTKCFTSTSDTGTCTGNSGIALPTADGTKFFMLPNGSGGSAYTSTATWFAGVTSMSFTTVDFSDVQ